MTGRVIHSSGRSRREEGLIGLERTPPKKSKSPHVDSYSNPARPYSSVGTGTLLPHYRLRDPVFVRIFEPMTTISRTFRKKGMPGEFHLVRGGSDQNNSLALLAGALIFARKIRLNQSRSK